MKEIIIRLVVLMSFLGTEILACPAVSGFTANPDPVAVGEEVTFSAVITPQENQTLVGWTLTVNGQTIMNGTDNVNVSGIIFETPGKKTATLTGTWQDKDGNTHTGFIGDPDVEFTVFSCKITGPKYVEVDKTVTMQSEPLPKEASGGTFKN